jgi:hypothetical protein
MDSYYRFLNLFPMPLWLAMMFAPRAPVTHKASRSSVVFALAALQYGIALVLTVVVGRRSGEPPALDFASLDGIRKGLGTREGALAAWSHMLALDLFAGAWIYRESMRIGAPGWVRIPALFLTLMTGPLGLLFFLTWRVLGAGRSPSIPASD